MSYRSPVGWDDELRAFDPDDCVAARTVMTPNGPMVIPGGSAMVPPPSSPTPASSASAILKAFTAALTKTAASGVSKMATMPSDYCGSCGSKLRPMFNMAPRCPNDCTAARARAPEPTYPLWWSHWAGTPQYQLRGEHSTAEDIVRLSDAVVVFEMTGGVWDDTARIKDGEVFVVKNLTWDSTVGKFFKVTERQEKRLCENASAMAESLQHLCPRAATHMTGLKRSQ